MYFANLHKHKRCKLNVNQLSIDGQTTLKESVIGSTSDDNGTNITTTINKIIDKAAEAVEGGGIKELFCKDGSVTLNGGESSTADAVEISAKGGGGGYTGGNGITIDGNTINSDLYVLKWRSIPDSEMAKKRIELTDAVGIANYKTGDLQISWKEAAPAIDIVEVTCDQPGQTGEYSVNIYTADTGKTYIHVWAYQMSGFGGNVERVLACMGTLYHTSSNDLENKYWKNYLNEFMNSDEGIHYAASRNNMYIPNKQGIYISKNEQSFKLEQYIPKIYYSGQDGEVYKVNLSDCIISPYDLTNTKDIQRIQIKYVGEHNKYIDKESIVPVSLYMQVME